MFFNFFCYFDRHWWSDAPGLCLTATAHNLVPLTRRSSLPPGVLLLSAFCVTPIPVHVLYLFLCTSGAKCKSAIWRNLHRLHIVVLIASMGNHVQSSKNLPRSLLPNDSQLILRFRDPATCPWRLSVLPDAQWALCAMRSVQTHLSTSPRPPWSAQ